MTKDERGGLNINNVLFIGNSHTFYESLPWVFESVCKQAGIPVRAFMSTYPGCDWQRHLESECTMGNLRYGLYDYAVIQQRAHPFDGEEALISQGSELIKEIQKTGARPVIFVPWSEHKNPKGQETITQAHKKLHELFPVSLIADCGKAWHSLRNRLDLYAIDGEHQNPRGAYLNACVLAKTIFGIDPKDLPIGIDFKGLSWQIKQEDVKLLQGAASIL